MTDKWDFYMCRVDNQPASIFLDMGIGNSPPSEAYPWMAYLRIFMRHPGPDGLPSSEEFEALKRIEDRLEEALHHPDRSLYVGRNTSNGCRDFYFYAVSAEDWSERVQQAMAPFPEYEYAEGARSDPEWSSYWNFLYPSETDIQVMQNRRVLEQLESHGDRLTEAREIVHWAYFPHALARQAFEAKAKSLGFRVLDHSEPDEECTDFGITLVRVDVPSHQEIYDATLPLFHLARECGGEYDGWETTIIT